MSFANRAYKAILKQYKKEGKEIKLFPERCNTGLYKKLDEKFAQFDGNIIFWPENPLDKNTVPEIIDSMKKYYLLTKESLSGMVVADPIKDTYGINDADVLREPHLPDFLRESFSSEKTEIRQDKAAEKEPHYNVIDEKPHDKVIDELEKALEDYYRNPGNTVSNFLVKKIRESNIKPSDIYNSVYMSKQNYSKIISNQTKNPHFEACIQFAFGLKLNLEDTTELLRLAGNAFSDAPYHRIVKYFIEKQKYNMFELNKCLDKFGIDPIGSF